MLQGQYPILGVKELWKTKTPGKCRFFVRKIWTSEQLLRHGLPNNGPCILCSQESETMDHLLLVCVYSREVWFKVLRRCGWQGLVPSMNDCLIEWWLQSRKLVQKPRHKALDSMFILVSWCIWCRRNKRVFYGSNLRSPTSLVDDILQVTELWSCEISGMSSWVIGS
jgi:hypothetical protein